MFKQIREDIRSIKERDPAARTGFEVLFLYSGIHAVIAYRISHFLFKHKLFILARCISQFSKFLTGIEIHPGAKIGKGLFIDHGSGVVIGETSEVGDYCTIYQGATLGGTGKEKGKRHPTIGNNVMVGSGAKILGPFTVGDNAKIAANAVVLEAVPSDCTAVGVPARIVKRNGERLSNYSNLDQIHIPDPISQEICRLYAKIDELHKEITSLKEDKKSNENL
jgi:serine O-acetyltransferase